jgi:hypothetical protein
MGSVHGQFDLCVTNRSLKAKDRSSPSFSVKSTRAENNSFIPLNRTDIKHLKVRAVYGSMVSDYLKNISLNLQALLGNKFATIAL